MESAPNYTDVVESVTLYLLQLHNNPSCQSLTTAGISHHEMTQVVMQHVLLVCYQMLESVHILFLCTEV